MLQPKMLIFFTGTEGFLPFGEGHDHMRISGNFVDRTFALPYIDGNVTFFNEVHRSPRLYVSIYARGSIKTFTLSNLC